MLFRKALIFLIAWLRHATRDTVHFITEKLLKKIGGSHSKAPKKMEKLPSRKVNLQKTKNLCSTAVPATHVNTIRALICIIFLNNNRLLIVISPAFITFT